MNKLSIDKRTQILTMLVEGNSLRATSRMADVSINTVTKLLVDAGKACQDFHNEQVVNVKSKRIQCDEIWSFVYAKDKNAPADMKEAGEAGDVWTWVGIDADSKLVVSWLVGDRSTDTAIPFMNDLALRLANKVQLTSDGHKAYLVAIEEAFTHTLAKYTPEQYDDVFRLSLDGCGPTEIGKKIGLSRSKVSTILKRNKKRLRVIS